MKKLAAFCIVIFVLAGCVPHGKPISSDISSSTSSEVSLEAPSESSSAPGSTNVWQMEEYQKIEPLPLELVASVHPLGITSSHILFSSTEEKAQRSSLVMDYDLKNKSWKEIGNYNNWDVALEDWIQIGGKTYFTYNDFFDDRYRLICIDTDNQKVTHPAAFDFYSPKAFYEAMDDKNFFLCLFSDSSKEISCYIYLYNIEENNCRKIYTGSYSDINRMGIIVQDISAQDQLLYILCKVFEGDGKCEYKIIVCNSEEEQVREIILDDLTQRLLEDERHERYDYIESFTVLGDCFFFKLTGSQYLYTYEEGVLRLLELPSRRLTLDKQRGDNLRDREKNPYYYFWDAKSKTLYPFNCQAKTFTKLPFIRENDENISINIWDDAEGNLLMSYFYKPQGGEAVPKFYYIPQSTILKYME